MFMPYLPVSFNDANSLQHDNIHFRQTDVITVGGLYFS